ncbi:putative ABC transporter permease [Clostridium sp. SHJSY1]|uniref:putative ABC transporter permease n=1 Tax=Clostridium sp. SHJSY1 TaxID=2942483 RepID=UPI00287B9A2F|nr:putative ABC transporter permease [Clostridium sp. SHJSY1]
MKITKSMDGHERRELNLNEFGKIYLYFMIYSLLGWVWEKIFTLVFNGELREIGFLHIPVCIIYGVGALLILFLYYRGDYDLFTIFLGSTIVIGILEFFTSWMMEKLFHRVWWDYSTWIYNLQGRISLISSLAFGFFGLIIVKWGHSFIYKVLDKYFQKRISIIISFILLTVTVIDLIFTSSILLK